MISNRARSRSLTVFAFVALACTRSGVSEDLGISEAIVRGRVTAAGSGTPMSGVTVDLRYSSGDCLSSESNSLATDPAPVASDAAGYFTARVMIVGLPPNPYCVRARAGAGAEVQSSHLFNAIGVQITDTLVLNLQVP